MASASDPDEFERPSLPDQRWRVVLVSLVVIAFAISWRISHDWDEPRAVAHQFLEAVIQNDTPKVCSLLVPALRTRVLPRDSSSNREVSGDNVPKSKVRVKLLTRTPNLVEIEGTVTRLGYSIKPRLTLQRQPDDAWLVVRIDHLSIDPRWEKRQAAEKEESEVDLAASLAKALNIEPENALPSSK